jgi:hypothetical protein
MCWLLRMYVRAGRRRYRLGEFLPVLGKVSETRFGHIVDRSRALRVMLYTKRFTRVHL